MRVCIGKTYGVRIRMRPCGIWVCSGVVGVALFCMRKCSEIGIVVIEVENTPHDLMN